MAIILSLGTQTADFYYKLALEQLENGFRYEAILNLIKAVELDDNPTYKMQLAEAYYNTYNYSQSTNLYIKLFFADRKFTYALAIHRNLQRMGQANAARNFILFCFQDLDSIIADMQDELPDIDAAELQKIMGIAEGEYAELFAHSSDDELIEDLRMQISQSDYDNAIMDAMEIPSDSKVYDIAQEVICIAAHARGDDELAIKTAKALLARQPSSIIAFGVLAMTAGITQYEISTQADQIYTLVKSDPNKLRDFLRAIAHLDDTKLFGRYIDDAHTIYPYVLDIVALKMFDRYANGDKIGGDICLKRLQMLFPNDFRVKAYTSIAKSKCPNSCWQEYKYTSLCTFDQCINDKFYNFTSFTKMVQQDNIGAMCAMILNSGGKYVGHLVETYMINKCATTGNCHANNRDAFLEGLLSDINILPHNKCDLIYGMLLFGWDSDVDIMIEDSLISCRLASLSITTMPIKLARLYCEAYIKMIQLGKVPYPEVLEDVLKRMQGVGIKQGMKQEALLAVLHCIYDIEEDETEGDLEHYAYLYEANPKTVQKYYPIFSGIMHN